MKAKKTAAVLLSAVVLTAAIAAAAIAAKTASGNNGRYERDIIDRVHFTVEPTQFPIPDAAPGEECELSFTLTAKKTEADFYAILHSVEIDDLDFTSVRFQTESGAENAVPTQYTLPAANGKALETKWVVSLTFTPQDTDPIDFNLSIDYSAGITQATADEHVLHIPMHIVFQ